MKYIHINCDLGEGGEADAQLMPYISACNIACGGHAGTVESMHDTVVLAMENNVEMGAHPSYPDRENFGRKTLAMTHENLQQSLVAQILSLKQIAEAEGGKLTHIKPHGALYNDVAIDEKIAQIVLDSVLEFEDKFSIYTSPNSVISRLAEGKIDVVFEAFADRNYQENGQLVSRDNPNALITKKEAVFQHLFLMFTEGKIRCENQRNIHCNATTFCLHSDTPNAVEILKYLQQRFRKKNIEILRS